MKTVKIERTPTTFFLPADDIRAAFQCASTEQARYYLQGVFVDWHDGVTNLVGLDGHVMVTIEAPGAAFVGEDCATQEAGFILSTDATDKAFKAKSSAGDIWVYGDAATGILQFVAYNAGDICPRVGVCEFERIDGTFPDWRRVIAKKEVGGSCAFDPKVFQKLVKASDVIEPKKAVKIWPGAEEGAPMAVEFKASERMSGTLMPYRWSV